MGKSVSPSWLWIDDKTARKDTEKKVRLVRCDSTSELGAHFQSIGTHWRVWINRPGSEETTTLGYVANQNEAAAEVRQIARAITGKSFDSRLVLEVEQ